jgi:hypothetical protein
VTRTTHTGTINKDLATLRPEQTRNQVQQPRFASARSTDDLRTLGAPDGARKPTQDRGVAVSEPDLAQLDLQVRPGFAPIRIARLVWGEKSTL